MIADAGRYAALPLDVSRETQERLDEFCARLIQWTPKINLIAETTRSEVWNRHILDSAQLFPLALPDSGHWVDLGSGGGLPGMVVAIIASEKTPDCRFTFVESDKRKAAFLKIMTNDLGVNARILADRVEVTPPLSGNIVSARALAPLDRLLGYVNRHMEPSGVALLPKGRNHVQELERAQVFWRFKYETIESIIESDSKIFRITGLQSKKADE